MPPLTTGGRYIGTRICDGRNRFLISSASGPYTIMLFSDHHDFFVSIFTMTITSEKEVGFEAVRKKSCHFSNLWRHPLTFPVLLWHDDREPVNKRMAVRDSAS